MWIWKDKWIPRHSTYMIQSPPVLQHPDATVRELIDEDTKWWNLPLLDILFTREEGQLIQSLPISSFNREDKCIWRGTKIGNFSVKSAYYLQVELETQNGATSSSQLEISRVWNDLWKLKIPNVEKKFHWRACHESLPTRSNLLKRKIPYAHYVITKQR